ncbi:MULTISPECIES: tetratricopeptide repeat protein [unclassified Bradyrhizobium]|uniref:tetratricopeptide repeat protein n=1 Tax=unclassified Bradyrhizobium TaxID=2631580 RepID=UPI0028EF6F3C|nr:MULTISPECIES: tetratricopeptide repeat protein [unclassified Bradyrhizobium]
MMRLFSHMLQYWRGVRCLTIEDFSGAIFHFSKVVQLNPRNHCAYHNRGVALQGMGSYASSIEDLGLALKLKPNAQTYGARGVSRKFLGDFDGAIDDQTRALALEPRLAAAHGELAYLHHVKGDLDRAIAQSTTAVGLAPKDPVMHRGRGYIQFCRGRFEAAAADMERSLALQFEPYAALFRYLSLARLPGRAKPDIASFAAYWAAGQWPWPVFDLLMERSTAQQLLNAAATAPEQAEAYFYIGEWYLLHGRKDEAGRALEIALRSLPPWFNEHPAAQAELARLAETVAAAS